MDTQENVPTTQNALNTEPDYGEDNLLFREIQIQQQLSPSSCLPKDMLRNQENTSRQSEFQKSGRLLFKEVDIVNELLNEQPADSQQILQKSSRNNSNNNNQNMIDNLLKSSQEENDFQCPSELTNSTKRVQFADHSINMKSSQRMNSSRFKKISKSSVVLKAEDIQSVKTLNNKSQTNDKTIPHNIQANKHALSSSLQFNQADSPQYNQLSQIQQRSNMKVSKKPEIKMANNWVGLKVRLESLRNLVKNLEMTGMLARFSKVQKTHLKLISDKGSDLLNEEKSEKQQSLLEEIISFENALAKISIYLYQIFRFLPTLNPSSLSVIIFKIILALQLVYQIFQFPLMIAFPANILNIFTTDHPYIRICFSISFIFEIFLNFNVFYFEHGERVNEKLLIIANYLKKDFFVDTLGLMGTLYVDQGTHYSIILIIFILRIMKFYLMYEAIEEKFQLSLRFAVPYTLINLIATITVIAHFFGCIFYYIAAQVEDTGKQTWISKNGYLDVSNAEKYVISLYFSFITMITVGYGDVTPVSYEERIFVIFMTLFSCGIFGFVVSSIGNLFAQIQIKNAEYKQQKYEISNYMETRSIDNDLKIKVFQTLETMNLKKQQEPENGQYILENMHSKLRESIYQNYYGKHLLNWKLFSAQFSNQFLESISVSCKEQIYGPGEVIFYQQESNLELIEDGQTKFRQDNQNIYLIVKGKVVVYQETLPFQSSRNKNKPMLFVCNETKDGECFGVKEFFCGIPYESTAHSIGLTSIIKIERSIFLAALQRFPKDYEQFAFIKDQLLFNNPEKFMKCQACKIHDHSMYQCPRMHFMKRRIKAILVHNSSFPQVRASCETARRSKMHAVSSNLEITRRRLKLFRVHFIYDLSLQQLNEKIGEDENNEDPSNKVSDKFAEGFNARAKKLRKAISSYNSESSSDDEDDEDDEENEDYENSSGNSSNNSKNGIKEEENEDENLDEVEEKLRAVQKKLKKKSISKAKKQFLLEMKDLKKNMDEQEDEMFFFRCPVVFWNEDTLKYSTSFKVEEEECNEAIQQYLESNFNVFLNNEGSFTLPTGLDLSSSDEEEEFKGKKEEEEHTNISSQKTIPQGSKTNLEVSRQTGILDRNEIQKLSKRANNLIEKKPQIDSHKPIIDHTKHENTYYQYKPTKELESNDQEELIVLQNNSLSSTEGDYFDKIGNQMNLRKTLSIHSDEQNKDTQEENDHNQIELEKQENAKNTPIAGNHIVLNLAETNLNNQQDNMEDDVLLNKLPRAEFQSITDQLVSQNSNETHLYQFNQSHKAKKQHHLRNAVKLIQTQKENLNHPEKRRNQTKQSIKVLISMSQDIMNNLRRKQQQQQTGFYSDSNKDIMNSFKQRNTFEYLPNHQGKIFDSTFFKKAHTHDQRNYQSYSGNPLSIISSTQNREERIKANIINKFKQTKKPRTQTNLINVNNFMNRKQNKESSHQQTIALNLNANTNNNTTTNRPKDQKQVSFSQDNIQSEKSFSEQDFIVQNQHYHHHKDERNLQEFFQLALDKPADFTNFYPKQNMQVVILKYIKYQEKKNQNKPHRQIFTPNIKSSSRARNMRKSNSQSQP